jgi:hypothetical protein
VFASYSSDGLAPACAIVGVGPRPPVSVIAATSAGQLDSMDRWRRMADPMCAALRVPDLSPR